MTGNFSKRAAEEAAKFGTARIAASSKDKNFTHIPDVKAIAYDPNASYIHICQNNTIFGTTYKDVPQVDGILVADMSSMIFSEPTDVGKYGCIYFGVQKNVAPAGMAHCHHPGRPAGQERQRHPGGKDPHHDELHYPVG